MTKKEKIHLLLATICEELLEYIVEQESNFPDRWVPASQIKNSLALNFVAVPQENIQYGEKGWLFAILARMLQDSNKVEFKKVGARSYYRSHDSGSWQTILAVGCEGGGITLLGKKKESSWIFKVSTDESSMASFCNKEDLPAPLTAKSEAVPTWEEALKLLGQYEWACLYPLTVHPEFADKIMTAVNEVYNLPGFDRHRDTFDWGRWKQVSFGYTS